MRIKNSVDSLPAILYGVYILKINLSKQDIYSIQNKLKRVEKKYPYISYLLVTSNTDSDYCRRRKLKIEGKKGRPKEIVIGKKIGRHVHLAILGNEENSAYQCLKDIQKTFEKRFGKGKCNFSSKGKEEHAKNFINYSLKQASYYNKHGIFDDILEKGNIIESDYL